jgi:lipopolysaccharide export system protein LptA
LKLKFKISKIALVLSAIFLLSFSGWSQNSIIELLPGSYKMVYSEALGAHRLVGGGVNFVYQGNKMYCDSAHFFVQKNEVRAYGNVHINNRDTLNLFCDSLYYSGGTKKAKLWGNVRVRDRDYKLTTDTLEYDARKGQAIYRHGGRVESIVTQEVLTSRVGYFYPDSKNFSFSGKVKFRGTDLTMTTDTLRYQYLQKKVYFYGPTVIHSKGSVITCERGWYQTETEEGVLQKNATITKESKFISGDSLYVNPQKGFSIGKGHVVYRDTAQPSSFKGDYAYLSDTAKYAYLTGNALLEYRLKKDTLYLHGDTLYSYQDSLNELKSVRAYSAVSFFSRDFQGKCDSLSFSKTDNRLEMYDAPIVWSKNAELKGLFMVVHLQDTLIQSVEILEKAATIIEVDSGQYYNQVGGRNMFAYFKNNVLIRVDVKGNAQTVYYPEETKENDSVVEIKRTGMMRVYSSDLRVYLDSGEVQGITYLDQPDGVFYPMDKINPEEQFVQGFSWDPLLRPASIEDLLNEKSSGKSKPPVAADKPGSQF